MEIPKEHMEDFIGYVMMQKKSRKPSELGLVVKSGFTGAYSTCTPSTSSTNIPEKEVLAGFADEVIYSLFAKQSEDWDLLHEEPWNKLMTWALWLLSDGGEHTEDEEQNHRHSWKSAQVEDSVGKPLYNRFIKTNDFKGVPHPLSGDYTPTPQEEIDESLYVYGKKGPQEPEPSVTDDRSSECSTCQSNDSAGSIGTSSVHSVDSESEISSVPPEVQPIKDKATPKRLIGDWNAKMEKRTWGRPNVNTGSSTEDRTMVVEVYLIVDAQGTCHVSRSTGGFEEFNRGSVIFGELGHFNLFSISQICDKQHKVLFTETECLVVSSDFKMPDENQILLKVPRHHNMYSFDMKTPTPAKGFACLIAKATSDESKLWHKRFSWVFFLASKDETSGILQNFIRQIENQLNHRVKIIRSDNGTEFKNRDMLEFCGNKGIKQEYSNARTPQQNGVAERMNRTLIEAARTMLADSLLPTTFWAEAVSTACYIFNRVRVTKPQNKTPYELLFGHKPIISYIRPFGCHVTILDTLSVLGKFDGKSDEGFLVDKPNVKGVGYRWMFDIDYLTDSMNYIPVSLENQANPHAGASEVTNSAGTSQTPNANASEEKDEDAELIVVPSAVKNTEEKVETRKSSTNSKKEEILTEPQQEKEASSTDTSEDNPKILAFRRELEEIALKHLGTVSENNSTNTLSVNSGSDPVNTGELDPDDSPMPELKIFHKSETGIFDEASYDEEGVVTDFNSLPTEIEVSPTPTLRIHNIHPKSQILGDPKSVVQTRSKVQQKSGAHALFSYIQKQQRNNHKDQQHCLFACFLSQEEPKKISEALQDDSWVQAMQEELLQFKLQQVWVLVDLPHGMKVIDTKWVYRNKKDEREVVVRNKARLVAQGYTQEKGIDYDEVFALVARIEAIRLFLAFASFMRSTSQVEQGRNLHISKTSNSKDFYLNVTQEDLQVSSMANHTWLMVVINFLDKDLSHGNVRNRQLWPLQQLKLEYVAACKFCGQNPVYQSKTKHIEIRHHFIRDCYEKKLISVEKIHTDLNVADLLTKPFDGPQFNYLVVSIEIKATIDTIRYTISEASIRESLQLEDATGITMLPNDELFEGMGQMGYPTDGTFTFWKSFFTPQWRFLVHHLLHCISSKSGGWDQFGSNIATALICLSTGQEHDAVAQPIPTPTPPPIPTPTPPPIPTPTPPPIPTPTPTPIP
ncbi:ribonuclease H-like domain-containing protein [Tanacetum coccineum]